MDFVSLFNGLVSNPLSAGMVVKALVSAVKVYVLQFNNVSLSNQQLGYVHIAITVFTFLATFLAKLAGHSLDESTVTSAVQYFVATYATAVATHTVVGDVTKVVAK